jgi:16S rRNA processing protein RimM
LRSSTEPVAAPRDRRAARPGEVAVVARGLRLRGTGGQLTATLVPGGIDQLQGRGWVLVGRWPGPGTRWEMEEYTTYGRKIVLKLRGVDSAALAEPLLGEDILLPCNGLVDLPEGTYYIFELVGMRVRTEQGRELGTVRAIIETGGAPLLEIEPATSPRSPAGGNEILLPMAGSICKVIDRASGRIIVDPPEGLLELYGL